MIPSHNKPREYTDKIDFSREQKGWGLRGEIHFHLDSNKILPLIADLNNIGIFSPQSVETSDWRK